MLCKGTRPSLYWEKTTKEPLATIWKSNWSELSSIKLCAAEGWLAKAFITWTTLASTCIFRNSYKQFQFFLLWQSILLPPQKKKLHSVHKTRKPGLYRDAENSISLDQQDHQIQEEATSSRRAYPLSSFWIPSVNNGSWWSRFFCLWLPPSGPRRALRTWMRQHKIPESRSDCLSIGCIHGQNLCVKY